MKKWSFRILLTAALVGLGVLAWRFLFPTPEQIIHKRLVELARLASFSGKDSPVAAAGNSLKLSSFCTPDVELKVDVPGRSRQTIKGRDELVQAGIGARALVGALQVEFVDINITVAPDKMSAVADLTARGKIPGDNLVQELKFNFTKVDGDWLINRVETVRTLF